MSSYLEITEASTTITVETDDWKIVFDEAKGGVIDEWYQGGGATNYASSTYGLFTVMEKVGGASHYIHESTTVITVKINTPNVLQIAVKGEMEDVSGHDYTLLYTIYPSGYIFIDYTFTNTTGGDLTITDFNYYICTDSGNFTNDVGMRDDNDSSPTYNDQFWFGIYSPDAIDSVYAYIISIDNADAQQEIFSDGGNTVSYQHTTDETWSDDATVRAVVCLYIGGNETDAAEIEADGIFLVPAHRTDATINTGTVVDDFANNVDAGDGLNASGARSMAPTAAHIAEIEFEQTEYDPALRLVGPKFLTGDPASPDDSLVAHWKMDDNAASTVVLDSSGDDYHGVIVGGNNADDLTNADAVRGTSIKTTRTEDIIDLSDAAVALADDDKFTIIIKFKPAFAYDTSSVQYMFAIGSGSENRITFYYSTSGYFFVYNDIANAGNALNLNNVWQDFDSGGELEQFWTIMLSLDLSNDLLVTILNGKVLRSDIITEDWSSAITNFKLCVVYPDSTTQKNGSYYFDDVILLNGCWLPYGAKQTFLEADPTGALAHSSILFHWCCESTTVEIGSKTVTLGSTALTAGSSLVGTNGLDTSGNDANVSISSEDILDFNKGYVAFWLNVQTWSNDKWIFTASEGEDNYIGMTITSDDELMLRYRHNGTNEDVTSSGLGLVVETWNYIEACWDDTGSIRLFVNHIEVGTANEVSASDWAGDGSGTLYFGGSYEGGDGADVWLDQITILDESDPKIADNWSKMGLSKLLPLLTES